MLLEFKTKNYKSFFEEADLIMTAAPKQKGFDYSLCRKRSRARRSVVLVPLCCMDPMHPARQTLSAPWMF